MNTETLNPGEQVLEVTLDGKFIWHPDADRLIREGDFTDAPALPHILRRLRAMEKQDPIACVIDGKLMAYKNAPLPDDCLLYAVTQGAA